jgi:hypothetical protein
LSITRLGAVTSFLNLDCVSMTTSHHGTRIYLASADE